MDNETMVLLTGLIGTIMVTGLLGAAIAGAYFFGRSRSARPRGDSSVAERVGRIEQLLESVAIEVERISEAQRYVARSLNKSPEEPGASRAVDGLSRRQRGSGTTPVT